MASDLILAFDTSGDRVALAVGRLTDNGAVECFAEHNFTAQRQANVQLMPAVEALFAEHDLCKSNVAAVVVGLGPGSFTGVRIAVATAKGVARGLGVPLYGVSTLDAVAWGVWDAEVRGQLGVVADAMRGEIYPARFSLSDDGVVRHDSHVVAKADAVAERWVTTNHKILLVGDGLNKYHEVFGNLSGAQFECLGSELWGASGHGLLLAFADAVARGAQGTGDSATLLPIYTRLSDAEENERKRLASGGQIAQGALVDVPKSGVADMSRLQEISYRPMAATDIAQVAILEQMVFASGSATSGERWSEAAFADELGRKDRSWWVAYVANELVGFAGAWAVDGVLQILDVASAPTHRQRGIARELMLKVLHDGQDLGAERATLEVRTSNTAAVALYASLGFKRLGVRPNYYPPTVPGGSGRENAVIMECLLTDAPAGHCGLDSATTLRGAELSAAAPTILAIETSCDETAAAIIDGNGQLLSNTIASQIDFHARFGGVVPEIASRKHTEAIVGVVDATLEEAGLAAPGAKSWQSLDAIAVTYAPGLIGALVVGVAFAKGLSWGAGLPLIRVNHLEGHIYANRFEQGDAAVHRTLSPPFIIALLSGGHTMLVHVRGWQDYRILGQSLDDAVGETFDKVAKALGLGYPGGPVISNLAQSGNPKAINFPRALLHSHDYQFSLSGLKTAVITYIRKAQESGTELDINDVAASFQQAVIDVQVAKAITALKETGCTTFCMGGGVAANKALREAYKHAMEPLGIRVIHPPSNACTDNAAMIALVALDRYRAGKFMPLDGDAQAHSDLQLDY